MKRPRGIGSRNPTTSTRSGQDLPKRGRPLTAAQLRAIDLLAQICLDQLMNEEAENMVLKRNRVNRDSET